MSNPEEEAEMDATPENIRAWAKKDPNTEWVHQDWDWEVARAEHADLILSLADENGPQSDFFVSCLYILVGSYMTTNGASISRDKIEELLRKGEQSSNQNIQHWVNRSRAFLKNPEQYDRATWADGGWALDENIWRFPDEERVAIIEEIVEAFHDVPRGEVTLHETDILDDNGSEEEAEKARRLDTEHSWEEIPNEWIEQHPSSLCFVDPQSWQYYIPAYMTWTLKNFQTSDSITAEMTIYKFRLFDNNPDLNLEQMKRFQQLNQKQSAAVCRFLRYMSQDDDRVDGGAAKEALQKYWGQFCPAEED